MINLPRRVNICECWARDGIQGWDPFVPTAKKIAIINRMVEIGFKRIEATSFAHPKLVKQFSDSLEVLKGMHRPKDVTFIAIIPNDKALDRLLEACDLGYGVQEITAILSASEDHMLANLERTFAEAMPPLADIVRRARQAGLKVIGCIGTAFGCPLAGEVPLEKVIELTDWYLNLGATSIMLGDTTGEANPRQVREVYQRMKDRFPGVDFIAHFHDTRGMGLANTLAALEEGIVFHDSSFGGMGGQPATRRPKYHRGFAGNTCTEDMVVMMEEMGIQTGLNLQEVIDAALMAEEICGRELLGHVSRSGPIRHRSGKPLSIQELLIGWEVPPALFLVGEPGLGVTSQELPGRVIREALEKNWPLPEGLGLDLAEVSVKEEVEERTILVTRFKTVDLQKDNNQALLEVLSQKADGDVYLEGRIKLLFR
jgi:hydroxymethylglutaryl-CoA lyase